MTDDFPTLANEETNQVLSELGEILASQPCTVEQVENFYQNGVNKNERLQIWKWLLGVQSSAITDWSVPERHRDEEIIRDEVESTSCSREEKDKMGSILEYYCTARNTRYRLDCGWAEILSPLSSMSYGDMYATFYALLSKFVPRNCKSDGKPFHLFRLLLLYHDPELCTFLDTKKCSPDLYAQRWFRSLYVCKCPAEVTREMWTRYLLQGDPFMVFYLGLVILVNAREIIMEMESESSSVIAEKITSFPDNLSVEDVEDFVSLAKYYGERTPASFRLDYHSQMFGNAPATESNFASLSQALCLPISVSELLQRTTVDGITYLVVDCRPKDQFEAGHLHGALHLDPDTMLSDPGLFTTAVATVLVGQQKTIKDDELCCHHLCFMGNSREEEDHLLNMIIAHFLHRKTQFVCSARNGYKALHDLLEESVDSGLEGHDRGRCAVCVDDIVSRISATELTIAQHPPGENSNIVSKMSSAMKVTSNTVKSRLGSLWREDGGGGGVTPSTTTPRHVAPVTKSKPYRGVENVFSIDDGEDEPDDQFGGASSSEENEREVVNIKLWKSRSDIVHSTPVEEITPDGKLLKAVLMLTETHLYNIRCIPDKEGHGFIKFRHPYSSIAKITAKKKHPDLISFKFIRGQEDLQVVRFIIPDSKTVTTRITTLIPGDQ